MFDSSHPHHEIVFWSPGDYRKREEKKREKNNVQLLPPPPRDCLLVSW